MNFRDYWLTHADGGLMPHVDVAEDIWKTAQEEFKKQLDDELTAAFMLGYQSAKNDYGRKE
jgi:hypothetical protein